MPNFSNKGETLLNTVASADKNPQFHLKLRVRFINPKSNQNKNRKIHQEVAIIRGTLSCPAYQ